MAENTRLKDLSADVKRILDIMETRDRENATRFKTLESAVNALLQNKAANPSPPFLVRSVKLDFPRFDGSDVLQWIFKAEQFCSYYNTPDDQRLTIAATHLDKDVVPWYQMMTRHESFHSWVAFTRALELEFGPSPYECSRSHLFKLNQTASVHEYYVQFTALANRVQGVTAEALLDCFIGGLKPDIRRDVIAQSPSTLIRSVSLAKLYEEKYMNKPKHYQPYTAAKTPTTNTSLPITQTIKSTNFQWSASASAAFESLKLAITQAPVLALPDFSKPFEWVLGQSSAKSIIQLLSSLTKTFSAMQNQSTYTREFYAITEAIAKFRHYLLGHRFVIRTDQKSLKSLTEQAIQTPEQQKWLHKLLGYDFTIEYKLGKDNIVADSLSRSYFMAWSQPTLQILPALREAISQDIHLKAVLDLCLLNKPPHPNYSVHDNLLFWKGRLIIPKSHALIQQLLHEFHSSLIGGHTGFTRTLARISTQFYWKGMHKDIQQFVQTCLVCQQAKTAHTLPAGLLQPLPIPEQIWDDIAMDFIIGLPSSNGFTVIFTDYSSKSVAEVFVKTVVKLHGIPKTIVSDRDKQLFKLSGTSLHMSTAYHPQSDGQSESLNKFLEMYLRCFTYDSLKDWARLLPWAEYWYNTSYHHSCGMTPFKIVYGRDHPTLFMKKHADKKRKFMKKLQPYRQHSVALRKNQKLSMRFFGPFPVIQRIGQVAYKLLLPPTTKIHPVFHCSQLKLCKGDPSQSYVPLPITHTELPPVIQPAAILQSRLILRGSHQVPQHLVQWEGIDMDNATWEDQSTLQQVFPDLNLEDKVGLNGGGIVTHGAGVEGSNENTTQQGIRRGTRNRLTNSRLDDFYWSRT
ncbi:hypothetical protein V8G54_028806 [Vigna mungo]|uniref:Integrase catalytic domain-containing protein n=1 Tax=Vigna mungo TaxID=3915 RepID=A0AAQ3RM11_VIGMU